MIAPALVLLLSCVMVAAPAEFHVAPHGDDAAPGTAAAPFATLGRARDAVKGASPAGPRGVVVAAGTYPLADSFVLGADDSGTPESPVVWRAAPGAEVRLTRGTSLPASLSKPVTDAATLARLDPAAQPHVLWASLEGVLPGWRIGTAAGADRAHRFGLERHALCRTCWRTLGD